MPTKPNTAGTRAGDWIECRGVHGQAPRRGEIIEVLDRNGHEHYRVRWDEEHESIVYPADGVIVTPGLAQRVRGAGRKRRQGDRHSNRHHVSRHCAVAAADPSCCSRFIFIDRKIKLRRRGPVGPERVRRRTAGRLC